MAFADPFSCREVSEWLNEGEGFSRYSEKIPLTAFLGPASPANLGLASLVLLQSSTLVLVLLRLMVLELSQILLVVSLLPLRVLEPFEPRTYR